MYEPLVPTRQYNPNLNSAYLPDGSLVDRLTGQVLATSPFNPPVQQPALAQLPVIPSPQLQQMPNQEPQGSIGTGVDIGNWEKANNVYKQSSVRQKKLFDNLVDVEYRKFKQANPDDPLPKELLRSRLTAQLSKDPNNFIVNAPESSLSADLASTGLGAVTGLASAAAGLVNLGTGLAGGNQEYTAPVAKLLDEVDEATKAVASPEKQDFDRQFNEAVSEKGLGGAVGLYFNHPLFAVEDAVRMLGVGFGAGAAVKGGAKAATRVAAGATKSGRSALDAAEAVAKFEGKTASKVLESQALNSGANIVAQGALSAGQAAQDIGRRNKNFVLTDDQARAATVDGIIGGVTTGLAARYGVSPQSLLAGVRPVNIDKAGLSGVVRSALRSAGVEASANAVQGMTDGILTTAYDKDGNFDLSKVDWDHAITSAKLGGALGAGLGTVGSLGSRLGTSKKTNAAAQNLSELTPDETGSTIATPQATQEVVSTGPTATSPDTSTLPLAEKAASDDNFIGGQNTNNVESTESVQSEVGNASGQVPLTPAQDGAQEQSRANTENDFKEQFLRSFANQTSEQRANQIAVLEDALAVRAASPEYNSAVSRQRERETNPNYFEVDDLQRRTDESLIREQEAVQEAVRTMRDLAALWEDPASIYSKDNPNDYNAQAIIDAQIAKRLPKESPNDVVESLRGVLSEYKNTADVNKARFAAQNAAALAEWQTSPFNIEDGRSFEQLKYDYENQKNELGNGITKQLYQEAKAISDRITAVNEVLQKEHQGWEASYKNSSLNRLRKVMQVPSSSISETAARVFGGVDTPSEIRNFKRNADLGFAKLVKKTRRASDLAKRPAIKDMSDAIDTQTLSLQDGGDGFARQAELLTGAEPGSFTSLVEGYRQDAPQMYGKGVILNDMVRREVAGNNTNNGKRSTVYLNYFQKKQDNIARVLGEWRPLSFEDAQMIAGQYIPELSNPPTGGAAGTRRYIKRVVDDYSKRPNLDTETLSRVAFLRDWLLADLSEADYPTIDAARQAGQDGTSIRELRQANFEENGPLPFGRSESVHSPIKEVGDAVRSGDVSAALEAAIKSLPVSSGVVLRTLRSMLNRIEEPVISRVSEDPIFVNGRRVLGMYDPATAEIVIDARFADRPDIIAHEAAHAITQSKIDDGIRGNLRGVQRVAYNALKAIREEAITRVNIPEEAKGNLHEFVAEAMSNPEMQAFLGSYSANVTGIGKLRSSYNSFVAAIRKMLGLGPGKFSALEDVIGLSRILNEGMPEENAASYVVERAGFQSGLLSRYIFKDGQTQREDFGYMERLEDGTYRIETDADSEFGLSHNDFDSFTAAEAYTKEVFGGEIRNLSKSEQAVKEGLLSKYDVQNPMLGKVASAIEAALFPYLPPRGQDLVSRILQTLNSGAQWFSLLVDRFEIFNKLDRALASVGVDSRLYQSFESARTKSRAQTRIGADLPTLITGVNEKLSAIGRTTFDLGRYMYALHGLERNAKHIDKGEVSGFIFKDNAGQEVKGSEGMRAYLASISERDKLVLHAAAENVWSQWQKVLKEEQRSGIISDAQYRKLGGLDEAGNRSEGAYEYYVPLRNEEDLNSWLSPDQGVSGRSTEAADPFSALVIQLQQRMSTVFKNDAMRDLAKSLEGQSIPEITHYETFKLRWDVDGKLVGIPENLKRADNAVYWRDGGNLKAMFINRKTKDGEAIYKALRPNNMNQNAIIRGVASLTRFQSALNTGLSAPFNLKVIAWDIGTTLLNFQGAYGGNLTAAEGARLGLRSVINAASLLPMIATSRFKGKSDNAAYNLFGRLGAGINSGAFIGVDTIDRATLLGRTSGTKDLVNQYGIVKGGAKAVGNYGHSALSFLHSADDAIRFAGFVEYLKHQTGEDITTMSQDKLDSFVARNSEAVDIAVRGSKEINGNFERQGNGGLLHSIYAFWNAGLQGTKLFASIAGSRQGQYGLMAMMAMGVVSALNGVSQSDDDDGAGGSKYANNRNRTTAAIFGDVAIPLAYEVRSLYSLSNSLTLYLTGKLSGGEVMTDFIKAGWDTFSPITPLDSGDVGFSLTYAVTPTALQLVFPTLLGRNAFNMPTEPGFVVDANGKPISDPRPIETAGATTSTVARNLAWLLDSAGLESVAYPGRIDETIKSVFGSAYSFIDSALNPSASVIIEDKNPIASALFKDFAAQPNEREVQKKYRELQSKYNQEYRKINGPDSGAGVDLLANKPNRAVNRSAEIESQVKQRAKDTVVDGRSKSQWLQRLSEGHASGDDVAIREARVALYNIQLKQNLIFSWGIQELKKINAK